MDAHGIIRYYGRFINSDLPQEANTPNLLTKREKSVQFLIEEVQKKLFHARDNVGCLQEWKIGQRSLEFFWKISKNDYLLCLRERSKLKLDSPRIETSRVSKIGDVVHAKEDLPRGSWMISKIVEEITGSN